MTPLLLFVIILFLTLLQVTLVPANIAFAAIVAYSIFLKKTSIYIWLVTLSIIFSLFTNLGIGVVMLAFATTFFLLKFGSEFLPDNNLIKFFLVAAAVPLSEMFLILTLRIFS